MKVKISIFAMIILGIALTGCSKEVSLTRVEKESDKVIVSEDIDKNTIVVKEDGRLQVAIVEDFDKEYYDIEELKSFINEEINNYNSKNGQESIIFDAAEMRDNKVIVVQTYSDIEHYLAYNNIEGSLMSVSAAREDSESLPEVFYNSRGKNISREEALKKDKYMIINVKENTNIVVDGKIIYYHNGEFINSTTLQANDEEGTFLIYKDIFF